MMTASDRVLIIDDDAALLAGLSRLLGDRFDLATAESGAAALAKVETEGPFAAVLCDMRMPGMDGIEVLRRLGELAPDTVRMMLTGNADQKTAVEAINRGAIFRFFNKPTPIAQLAEGIEAAIAQHGLITAERQLLEQTLAGSVAMLTEMLSLVAPDIFQRSRRLGEWAARLARHMRCDQPWAVELAAQLVHLGSIAVPPEVLARHRSGQPLSPPEAEMIARIPEIGAGLLRKIPRLEPVADAIASLSDVRRTNSAPLAGRILVVLLRLDEIGIGVPSREAMATLERQQGRFDPAVLAAVRECLIEAPFPSSGTVTTRIDVPVSGIRVGDMLESDLVIDSGRLVLAAGEVISDVLYLRLHNIHRMTRLREPIRVRRQVKG